MIVCSCSSLAGGLHCFLILNTDVLLASCSQRSQLSAAPLGTGVCMWDLLTTSTCPAGGIHSILPLESPLSLMLCQSWKSPHPHPHHRLQALRPCTPLYSPQNWECQDTSGNAGNVWASPVLTGILLGHFSPVLLSPLQSLRVVSHILWRRTWQPTPVFLPGESHGQRSLAGYSLCSCKESDTTERLTHTY